MWDLGARPAILCLKASGTALCDSQRLYAAWCRQVGQEDSKTKKPRKNDENKTRTQDAIYPAVF